MICECKLFLFFRFLETSEVISTDLPISYFLWKHRFHIYVSFRLYFKMGHSTIKTFLALLFFSPLLVTASLSQQQPPCPSGEFTEEQLLNLSLECFQQTYKYQTHDGQKLARIIDQRVTAYKKILQHILMDKLEAIKTTPVVKWAQNKEKIFLNFKLSHRQDSPPCSDVRFDKFNVTNVANATGEFEIHNLIKEEFGNSSAISFEGFCFFTSQKFLFQLNLVFNGSLANLTIEKEGLGSYTLVGDKSVAEIWIDPFPDVTKSAIWSQIRQKHSKDMDEYFQMREQRKQEQDSKKGKRKKKRRSTPQTEKAFKEKDEKDKEKVGQGSQEL